MEDSGLDPFLLRCLALDLEVGKESGAIRAIGAVRTDTGRSLPPSSVRDLDGALAKLDEFSDGASFVLGHNLIDLLDRSTGATLGRLAKSFEPPPGMRCRSATVLAIVRWSRETTDPKYRDTVKSDHWEVVVPELVFEPDGT